jgi:4'-phosphopantetheinyl transferase
MIYPVILQVQSVDYARLSPKDRAAHLSRLARRALEISSEKIGAGLRVDHLKKNERGVPLPVDGWHWSLTHKPEFTGAVVSQAPAGMDLEKIKPIPARVYQKIAEKEEWDQVDLSVPESFFRYWTAKESVIKLAGTGLKDLSWCRIRRILDPEHLIIGYKDQDWLIEHLYFEGHIASVVKNVSHIHWVMAGNPYEHQFSITDVPDYRSPAIF